MIERKRTPLVLERSAAARERARQRRLEAVPPGYSPFLHLGTTVVVSLGVLAFAVHSLSHVRPVEWLVVPFTLMLGNLLEYRVHKFLLHRRRWPTKVLYDRHTPEHHAIYMDEDMAIRDVREFYLVLIPAFGIVALAVVTLPVAGAVAWLLGKNAGWLFLAASAFTMASYEVLHLSYHMPRESFVGRLWAVRVLRQHHSRHHDPRLMHRYNFNVTVPFFDWVLGTIYAEPSSEPSGTTTSSSMTMPPRTKSENASLQG